MGTRAVTNQDCINFLNKFIRLLLGQPVTAMFYTVSESSISDAPAPPVPTPTNQGNELGRAAVDLFKKFGMSSSVQPVTAPAAGAAGIAPLSDAPAPAGIVGY